MAAHSNRARYSRFIRSLKDSLEHKDTQIYTFRISGYTADRWYSGQINNIQKLVRRFFLAQPIISLFTFENVEWNNGQVQ